MRQPWAAHTPWSRPALPTRIPPKVPLALWRNSRRVGPGRERLFLSLAMVPSSIALVRSLSALDHAGRIDTRASEPLPAQRIGVPQGVYVDYWTRSLDPRTNTGRRVGGDPRRPGGPAVLEHHRGRHPECLRERRCSSGRIPGHDRGRHPGVISVPCHSRHPTPALLEAPGGMWRTCL